MQTTQNQFEQENKSILNQLHLKIEELNVIKEQQTSLKANLDHLNKLVVKSGAKIVDHECNDEKSCYGEISKEYFGMVVKMRSIEIEIEELKSHIQVRNQESSSR